MCESDFYAVLGLGFGGGTSFSTTYTAYTSPNSGFTTVKEVMFKLALDDRYLGKGAVKPYSLSRRSSIPTSASGRPMAARTRAPTWKSDSRLGWRRAERASRFRSRLVSA